MATKTIAQLTAISVIDGTTVFELDNGSSFKITLADLLKNLFTYGDTAGNLTGDMFLQDATFGIVGFEFISGGVQFIIQNKTTGKRFFSLNLDGSMSIQDFGGGVNWASIDANQNATIQGNAEFTGNIVLDVAILDAGATTIVDSSHTFYDASGNPGFTGTGTYTNFTISGGIITNAS